MVNFPNLNFNAQPIKTFLGLSSSYPPALTSGLTVFLVIIYLLSFVTSINEAIALNPWAPFQLNLNKISLYPLGHLSLLHLIFNVIAIISPLSRFESKNGTVYTGIVLNILAVSTALPFCLLGILFYPKTNAIGASAWVFSFAAYFAHKESLSVASFRINSNFSFPTIATPFIPLVLITIFFPGSSFMGHFFGIISGYLLSFGKLDIVINPPLTKVVPWIEDKLSPLIAKIPSEFHYYKENDSKSSRSESYTSIIRRQQNNAGNSTNTRNGISGLTSNHSHSMSGMTGILPVSEPPTPQVAKFPGQGYSLK
ncbi:putative rhomboid protease RBD2 ASCRUDRAFT_78199 [Ascoidea rubescens DSM 1968]|uniref:Rhomboid-type serine protease 2 n=1 Tax=Ascoidea rubescens DSM 1968 TaxID=1344418 RepID=A0A1D2V9A7_9ASCO|nr:hypothetical protein ASCRUDRAFT_78199 [Ascoidea rubescens DSM 1968]ODV58085.1 hypothetical protein ASCRUDRAFT_78199 [Ascoidea rubescens DSM 1968]